MAGFTLGTFLLVSFGFAGGRGCDRTSVHSLLWSRPATAHQLVHTTKTQHRSWSQLLAGKDAEAAALRAELAVATGAPSLAREVVQWRTRLVAAPPADVGCSPGVAALGNGVVVAEYDGKSLSAKDLSLRGIVIVGERASAGVFELSSSHKPQLWVEVPVELEVEKANDFRVFEPHLALGLTGSVEPQPLGGAMSASFLTTFIHPYPDWDVLGLRVSANSDSIRSGVDVIGYNVGAPLPVVQDLWIYAGVSGGTTYTGRPLWGVDLTVATKF